MKLWVKSNILFILGLTISFAVIMMIINLAFPDNVYGALVDWNSQHFSIPEYFRTQFYDTGDLFPNFAFHIGGGQNIYNFAYYGLCNPLIWVSYLLPWISMSSYIRIISVFSVWISTNLCYYLMQKFFSNKISFIIALLYLLAAPVIFHSHHHIMFVNYFPFLFLAMISVHKLQKNKFSLLLLISSLCILLSSFFFSIGAFIAIIIYGIFIFVKSEKNDKKAVKFIGNIIIHLFISGLIAGILLIPVAMTLLSNRDETNVSISILKLFFPVVHLKYILYSPFSIGLTSLSLFAVIFMIQIKEKAYRFLSIFFVVILCVPFILYMMNGTMYLDAKAFIPLLPLLLLVCGRFLECFSKNFILILRTLILFIIAMIIGLLVHDGTTSEKVMVLIDGFTAVIATLIYLKIKKDSIIIGQIILLSSVCCLCINLMEDYMTKNQMEEVYNDTVEQLTEEVLSEDNSFYRFANEIESKAMVNRIYNSEYYQDTIYSSIQNKNFTDFYLKSICNENEIRNSATLINSKNILYNVLMGNKYTISKTPLSYFGYELYKEKDGYYIYINKLAFPVGYVSSNCISTDKWNSMKYPYKQSVFLENIIIESENFTDDYNSSDITSYIQKIEQSYELSESDYLKCKDKIKKDKNGYWIESDEEFTIKVNLNRPIENNIVFLQFSVDNRIGDLTKAKDVYVTINNIKNKLTAPSWKYQNRNYNFEYTFSFEESLNQLEVTFSKGTYFIKDGSFYTMNLDLILNAREKLDSFEINREATKGDKIEGEISVKNNGWFTISVPYDEGFHIEVDGQDTKYYRTNTEWIGFPILKGEHKISIVYTSRGFKEGVICSCFGILITIIYALFSIIFTKKYHSKNADVI